MRDKFFKIRVTGADRAAWEAHVQRRSLGSVSSWLRELASADMQSAPGEVETPPGSPPQGAIVTVKSVQNPCSRFFLHRPGVFCKECGS